MFQSPLPAAPVHVATFFDVTVMVVPLNVASYPVESVSSTMSRMLETPEGSEYDAAENVIDALDMLAVSNTIFAPASSVTAPVTVKALPEYAPSGKLNVAFAGMVNPVALSAPLDTATSGPRIAFAVSCSAPITPDEMRTSS